MSAYVVNILAVLLTGLERKLATRFSLKAAEIVLG